MLYIAVMFLLAVEANDARTCTRVELTGFNYQILREGNFDLIQGDACFGRPVFKHTTLEFNFLFFHEVNATRRWMIGPNKCGELAAMRAAADGTNWPHEVSAVWEEYNYNNNTWQLAPAANSTCLSFNDPSPSLTPVPRSPNELVIEDEYKWIRDNPEYLAMTGMSLVIILLTIAIVCLLCCYKWERSR